MAPFDSAAEHCRRAHGWAASMRLHSARHKMFQHRTLPQRTWCLECTETRRHGTLLLSAAPLPVWMLCCR